MKFDNPFSWLASRLYKTGLITFGLITIILFVAISIFNTSLVTPEAPTGIISFELAGNIDASLAILASWDESARVYAALSLGIDFAYLIAYGLFLSLACYMLSDRLTQTWRVVRFSDIGSFISWLPLVAALFDAIENTNLIFLLLGSKSDIFPSMASLFAITKFILVFLAILYLIIGLPILFYLLASDRKLKKQQAKNK